MAFGHPIHQQQIITAGIEAHPVLVSNPGQLAGQRLLLFEPGRLDFDSCLARGFTQVSLCLSIKLDKRKGAVARAAFQCLRNLGETLQVIFFRCR